MKRIRPLWRCTRRSAPGARAPRQLDKANVLPLALDDAFQFRKTKIFLNEPELFKPTTDPMIAFERLRVNFKAVSQYDRQQRYGHYYTFFWKSGRKTDLTVRFEYRQQRLGSYGQARSFLPGVKARESTSPCRRRLPRGRQVTRARVAHRKRAFVASRSHP